MPTLSIERRDLPAQPILFIRSRVSRAEIAKTIGDSLGKVFQHALASGAVIAGQPFARYPEAGPDLLTIDVGVPLASGAAGQGEIEAGSLQGGATVVAVHGGHYEQLMETFGAIERWMAERGLAPGGAPWEVYITDPANHPDSADWRTEVCWPARG